MEVITTHVNADFDCLGSMIAARKLYPEAEMVFAGSQERSLREFFLSSAAYSLGISRIRDIDLDAITRLILVDVRQSERIGPFGEVATRPGVDLHIYDHHPEGQSDLKGSLEIVEPVGSTVTVLTHLFMERGISPTAEEATIMMLGLYEDTGSLLFNSTTGKDFQAGAFLLSCGANLNTVSDCLVQELTSQQVALLHDLIGSVAMVSVHGVEVCIAHATVDHYIGDIAILAHKLKDMENLDALIIAVRMEGRILMIGRSRIPEVHVGEVLGEFGGGGHAFAASGTVKDLTLVQILERLPKVLNRHVHRRSDAKQLMSAPVKTVESSETIDAVRAFLTRYNINAAPVMKGRKMVGIITRQVVDKAVHHGLSGLPVADYMSCEVATVSPSTDLESLRRLIVGRSQRLVPVLEEAEVVGVITRTDLLRQMVSGQKAREGGADSLPAEEFSLKKKDVARLMRSRLPGKIWSMLRDMGRAGEDLGVSVFVVGGFVRDLLLNQQNLDIDIVVEGDGIAFAGEFARRHDCRMRSHRKFGTAVIIFPDGFKIDVASTRMEYYLEPAALPTVEHASIRHDLTRRDFTINTLAIALNGPAFGELLDYFGAQRDLKDGAIRVLHNLSFVEDPTRMLRAVRFEQRLRFALGQHTEQLLKSAVQSGFMEKVGGGRLFNEMVILLKETSPVKAMMRLEDLGLLKYVHPSLTIDAKVRLLFAQADRLVNWYDLLYTGRRYRSWLVYLLCLTTSLDNDAISGILGRLNMPAAVREILERQRAPAHGLQYRMERRHSRGSRPAPSDIYAWLEGLSTETLLYLMARTSREEVRRWVSHYITNLQQVKPRLSGRDLEQLGLPAGPLYRDILRELLLARLDGRTQTREDERSLVRRKYRKLLPRKT